MRSFQNRFKVSPFVRARGFSITVLSALVCIVFFSLTGTASAQNGVPLLRFLSVGSEGEDVRELQKFLNGQGFTIAPSGPGSPGQETNYFGPLTAAALERFQCTHNVICAGSAEETGLGVFGPRTRTLFLSLMDLVKSAFANIFLRSQVAQVDGSVPPPPPPPPPPPSTVDETPPFRFGGSPSGDLTRGNGIVLTVQTDETATCRYGSEGNVPYASLPESFSSSNGGFLHTASLQTLSGGRTHTYFVRCVDGGGNINRDDHSISFGVFPPEPVSEIDIEPPTVTRSSPSGVLSARVDQVLLSVTTSENALCRFDTAPRDSFEEQEFLFPGEGTVHEVFRFNLSAGDYAYYVRCKDAAGNVSGDHGIFFSITTQAIAPILPPPVPGDEPTQPPPLPAAPVFSSPPAAPPPFGVSRPSVSFPRSLGVGDVGEDVRELQKFLNARGFRVAEGGLDATGSPRPGSPGNETAVFGSATLNALIRFQEAHGIPPVGRLGPQTRGVVEPMLGLGTAFPAVAPSATPTPASVSDGARYLERGMRGGDVLALQKFLNRFGFTISTVGPGAPGQETGYFGLATERAIQGFQKAADITPVGRVGPQTEAFMRRVENGEVLPPVPENIVLPVKKEPESVRGIVQAGGGTIGFSRPLSVGSQGEDVRELQKFLNNQGFIIAKTGPGSPGNETTDFSAETASALVRFQDAYAAHILYPQGLIKGTGELDTATIRKIEALARAGQ